MKKRIIYILLCLPLAIMPTSCNYLDVVPNETGTSADAFRDVVALERYLYSCYSFIPQPAHQTLSIDLFTSDEIVTAFEHETHAKFPQGNYSPSSTVISYWNDLFAGIRQCYILLENIDNVPGVTPQISSSYKGEATFIIAYLHFLLLRNYGPTIIVDRLYDIDMPITDYPERSTYDECVDWIALKFDEAIALGLPDDYPAESYGRATKLAAMAIKSRMLLYAASPLFNGAKPNYTPSGSATDVVNLTSGTDNLTAAYSEFKHSDGRQLINLTYDASKWQRAAEASRVVIEAIEMGGKYDLYDKTSTSTIASLSDPTIHKLRMAIIERGSKELIWADARATNDYSLQNKSAPSAGGDNTAWNGVAPTMTMIKLFLTKDGLPITEAQSGFDYSRIEEVVPSNQTGSNHRLTLPSGTVRALTNTLYLNTNREPRFEAWIAYHNSYYEYNTSNVGRIAMGFRLNDFGGKKTRTSNFSPTGYLNKKGQHPLNSRGASGGVTNYYPWPIIRVAEVYLNYAEALIEVGGNANFTEALRYIDKIRTRAGIPTVEDAWLPTGKTLTQDLLRQIVRQERTIELYLENHRFWDVRRWLLGQKYFNVRAKGMDITKDDDEFFKITEVNYDRRFRFPQHYLMPIPIGDVNKNPRIKQNPGY